MEILKIGFAMMVGLVCLPWVTPAMAGKPASGDSIYQLTSAWTDQDGKKTTLQHFEGQPLVLAMIYTSCRDACPLIVSDMQRIEKGLTPEASARTQFALFSFDTKRDTPAKLKRYAAAHALDLKRWTLLRSSEEVVRELAAVLGVRYKRLKNGDFSHSSVISILDSEGVIRYQQKGSRNDPAKSIDTIGTLLKSEPSR